MGVSFHWEVTSIKQEFIKAIKQGNTKLFYASRTWRKKRKQIILRDNNECQRCKSLGLVGKAECVHHIKHIKDRPELGLTDSNLQTLCFNCHNAVHPEKLRDQQTSITKYTNEERWE